MNDLYDEILDVCNKTIGKKVSFRHKKELAESIADIFRNHFDETLDQRLDEISKSNINIFITPNFPIFPNINSTYFPNRYYIPMNMLPFQPQIAPILPQFYFTPNQPMNMFNMFSYYNQTQQKPIKPMKKIHKSKYLPKSIKNAKKKTIISKQKFSNQSNSQTSKPANSFILYPQSKKSEDHQHNLILKDTEVSRILEKKWNEAPKENKKIYEGRAQRLHKEFIRKHPEFLTKSSQNTGQESIGDEEQNHSKRKNAQEIVFDYMKQNDKGNGVRGNEIKDDLSNEFSSDEIEHAISLLINVGKIYLSTEIDLYKVTDLD